MNFLCWPEFPSLLNRFICKLCDDATNQFVLSLIVGLPKHFRKEKFSCMRLEEILVSTISFYVVILPMGDIYICGIKMLLYLKVIIASRRQLLVDMGLLSGLTVIPRASFWVPSVYIVIRTLPLLIWLFLSLLGLGNYSSFLVGLKMIAMFNKFGDGFKWSL